MEAEGACRMPGLVGLTGVMDGLRNDRKCDMRDCAAITTGEDKTVRQLGDDTDMDRLQRNMYTPPRRGYSFTVT